MRLAWRIAILGGAAAFIAISIGAPEDEAAPFAEFRARCKLLFEHRNSPTSSKYLPETMGAGVALLDYNNDGRLDIFFTNGARLADPMPAGMQPDKREPQYWNRLFHQNPNGTFQDVTVTAGVSGSPAAGYSMGVAVGDYDNDGFEDLLVTGYGGNILYHNNGNGTFTDVTDKAGVRASGWTASAGFFDFDNDGKLDLFVTRYLDWTFDKSIHCGDRVPGYRAYCHPNNFAPVSNLLFRNNGDGTFTDVSERSGIAKAQGKSLGVAFADYDGDGWTDIFVANDSVACFLFRNNGDGTFTETGLVSGASLKEDGNAFAGMGVDFADYDNDGRADIVITDLSNERYALFRNLGDGTFSDEAISSGVARATAPFSGWGIRFIDFDNDGWKDIFASQGHVLDNIDKTAGNLRYEQPPLLLRNRRGRFERVEGGDALVTSRAGRGAAFGDIDGDGKIDVVVANLGQTPSLLKNTARNGNHWLGLQLQGVKSNRDGIGARIEIKAEGIPKQYYTVNTASSYLSASDRRVIVGLGPAQAAADVVIRWPSGTVQTLANLTGGRMVHVLEPSR